MQPRGRGIFSHSPEPPLGLAYLAAALTKSNDQYEVEIIDGCLLDDEEFLSKIQQIDSDIIGVTTTMSQLSEALTIPKMANNPNATFIVGGSGVTNLP